MKAAAKNIVVTIIAAIGCALLVGCPKASSPLASTDASLPVEAIAPPPPATLDAGDGGSCLDTSGAPGACINACKAMILVGCVELCSCPTVLANTEAHRMRPNPANGNLPLTCNDLLTVKTAADVVARGWSCGGASP